MSERKKKSKKARGEQMDDAQVSNHFCVRQNLPTKAELSRLPPELRDCQWNPRHIGRKHAARPSFDPLAQEEFAGCGLYAAHRPTFEPFTPDANVYAPPQPRVDAPKPSQRDLQVVGMVGVISDFRQGRKKTLIRGRHRKKNMNRRESSAK